MARKMFALTALAATLFATAPLPAAAAPPAGLQEVMFVGNNWAGTVDVIRPGGGYTKLGGLSVIPDLDTRLWDIYLNPIKLA